jgi:hypothetical protein
VNIAELLHRLRIISNVEIVVPLLAEMLGIAYQAPRYSLLRQWSSFRHYATGGEGWVEIESEWTVRKRERAAETLCSAFELPHSS